MTAAQGIVTQNTIAQDAVSQEVRAPKEALISAQPATLAVAKHGVPSRSIWPEIAWLLPLLLVPLWINFWSFQPFDHAKSLLLAGLMWTAAGVFLVTGIGRVRAVETEAGLAFGPLHVAVLVWLCGLSLATVWAVDPMLSLFGSDLRGQGLLTQSSYVLFFFLLAWGVRTQAQIDRLFGVIALGTLPLLLIGFMQALGIDPLGLVSDARSPVHSTLGRANFTGAYLALVLPVTLNRLIAVNGGRGRVLWIVLLVAQLGLLALTWARSAWIGAGAGMAVWGWLLLWPRLAPHFAPHFVLPLARPLARYGARWAQRAFWWALWGGLSVVVLGASYGAVRFLATATEGSLAARAAIWRATWDLIRRRPWTGYGLDNLEIVFPWVYPPELVYYQGRDVYVDRAHNLFLDWTVAAGVPGLLSLLLVLGTFFYVARRAWKAAWRPSATRTRLHLATAIAVVAASVAGNLSGFDVTATALLTWAALGIVVTRPLWPDGARDEPEAPTSARGALGLRGRATAWMTSMTSMTLRAQMVRGAAAVLVASLAFGVVGYAVLRPTLAGVAHQAARQAGARGEWVQMEDLARRARALWPHSPAHYGLVGRMAQAQAARGTEPARLAYLRAAEDAYWAVIDRRPGDAAAWAELANFYARWPEQVDLPTARAAYDQALTRAPNLAVLWFEVAQLHLRHGDAAGALDALERTVDLDATHVLAYRLMAELYTQHGDLAAADRAYLAALRIEQQASK